MNTIDRETLERSIMEGSFMDVMQLKGVANVRAQKAARSMSMLAQSALHYAIAVALGSYTGFVVKWWPIKLFLAAVVATAFMGCLSASHKWFLERKDWEYAMDVLEMIKKRENKNEH